MASSKPLVRHGGRTQQGNISIDAVDGLQAELGGKVGNDDPRLSDSREWTATTVTQEEAEAGTASTRRAWTAQRVRQAINAWYLTVSTTFTRTLVGRSTAAQVRGDLGLGTAATRDVATNAQALAGTAGVLPDAADVHAAFNQYGYGGQNPRNNTLNCNDLPAGSRNSWTDGFPESTAVSLNLPALGGSDSRSWHVECFGNSTSRLVQKATEVYGIGTTRGRTFIRVKHDSTWYPWVEIQTTGNILTTTGQSTQFPMTQKAVTDAIANIDVSGPRPTKNHGAVATAGSQTVVCNVQESDFHIMSMETANTTGTLTIDFANMPDTAGKHFSWHVRLRRGGRKTVAFAQTISWAGGVAPSFGTATSSYDLIMFYKVDNETIRGMVIDAW